MTPDINKYRRYVDRFDLNEEQKSELIHTLWSIVGGFAYRAFGLDPVQQVTPPRTLKDASRESPVLDFEKVSNSTEKLADTFGLQARKRGRRKIRRP